MNIRRYISLMPKVELHLHIEGTFEPELMFSIGNRNNVPLKYPDVESLRGAYRFSNLQDFLDIYYQGASVLLHEQDFYDLTMAYFRRIHAEHVQHAEIFFDPQTHTDRGVAFDVVIRGIRRACEDAEKEMGITSVLVMHFLRHLSEESGLQTLEQSLPYKSWITAVGLDSSEMGNPPSKFTRLFSEAAKHGYKLQAHAGEEGPASYVWEALHLLNVERIDHGNRCLDDPSVVGELVTRQIALTLCPLSNLKLQVVKDLRYHPLRVMMDKGLKVTVNSDDPAYFGGYMNDNYVAMQDALHLQKEHLVRLALNAVEASYAPPQRKQQLRENLEAFSAAYNDQ